MPGTADAELEYMQHLQKIQQLVDDIDQKSKELEQADNRDPNTELTAIDCPQQHNASSVVSENSSKLQLHRIGRNQDKQQDAQRLEGRRISTKMQESPHTNREGTPDNTQDS